MTVRPRRRWWRWVLLVLALLVLGIFLALDPLLETALGKLAARLERAGHRITFTDVDINVLDGHLHIQGLVVEPVDKGTEADSAAWTILRADDVELDGVAMGDLLRHQVLRAHSFVVHAPSLEHSSATRKHHNAAPAKQPKELSEVDPNAPPLVRIDSLVIVGASAHSVDRAGIRPSVSVAAMDLFVKDVAVRVNERGIPVLTRSVSRLDLRGIQADLPPLYRFAIDSLRARYPEATTTIHGMALTSTVGPKEYHTLVEHRTDLITMRADSLTLTGFSLVDQVQDGAYVAENVRLFGGLIEVHHDKSIPDGPSKRKPLPAEKVKSLAVTLGIDTLHAVDCEVRYSERLKRGEEYGTLAFTDIDAVLTGLSNLPDTAPADLHLHGTARLSGTGRAMLDLRMPMHAADPPLTIEARLEGLDAPILNRMTDNLVHVNATAGRIHLVDLRMQGDDLRASGTMDMRYEDLHMELNNSVEHASLLSRVANMVVRSRNMPQDGNYRRGHFTVERRTDRSVFNYLWLGVKAGCMDVVLPTSVTKGVRKMKDRKKKG